MVLLVVTLIVIVGAVVLWRVLSSRKEEVFVYPSIEEITEVIKEEEQGKLVDDFPSDFPVYPASNVSYSYKVYNKYGYDGEGYEAEWTIEETVPKVMSWYVDALETAGWEGGGL